ncbi:radical SAM protein [Desulfoluna limicola]|uniref:Radical SAM protein n=1 Tax=Desulfoluna limicola TaxID=2810562 RepID=A0ABN6F2R5_9BACT|nr:radical SAM protein [Desulfoluna limicola]BCS95762.1 radical SAM protein [Desulfoluna limicola]
MSGNKHRITAGESPEIVQTSLAGAIGMGLMKGRFLRDARCECLNLLLTYDDGCKASCSYCGLSRNRAPVRTDTFIRVKWPTYTLPVIFGRLQSQVTPFRRACVSMVTHPRALDDTCTVIRKVKHHSDLPVSGLVSPSVMGGRQGFQRVFDAGADRVGIAIDAATPELFDRHRGKTVGGPHRWETYMKSFDHAVDVFGPFMVGVHLIVGLGETEEQMVSMIDRAHAMGVLTHLFSFFPERGCAMENHAQPPLGQYRRIQLARFLINENIAVRKEMSFSKEGKLMDFGVDIEPYVDLGVPFMTSGCPGNDGVMACNRPFGNERASDPIRNYPFLPDARDRHIIRKQLEPAHASPATE